jgi:hypothetical protein
MTITVGMAAASATILVNDFVGLDAGKFALKLSADAPIYGIAMEQKDAPPADGEVTVLLDVSEESIYEMDASITPTQAIVATSTDISGEQEVLTGIAVAPSSNNIVIHEIKDTTVLVSIIRDAVVPKAGA